MPAELSHLLSVDQMKHKYEKTKKIRRKTAGQLNDFQMVFRDGGGGTPTLLQALRSKGKKFKETKNRNVTMKRHIDSCFNSTLNIIQHDRQIVKSVKNNFYDFLNKIPYSFRLVLLLWGQKCSSTTHLSEK